MAHRNADLRGCIAACRDCHDICLETITYCLSFGAQHAAANHICLLMDCAQICATSADFMSRVSPRHVHTCRVCADVCERCAISCEQLAGAEMRRCAEECRRCAEECRRMSAAVAA
jgi:hypothetical protein